MTAEIKVAAGFDRILLAGALAPAKLFTGGSTMATMRSTDRIMTTHAGSLPRPKLIRDLLTTRAGWQGR